MVQPKNSNKFLSYLKAGYLLHIITVLEVTIFIILNDLLHISQWVSGNYFLLKLSLLSPFLFMPIFAQLDARSRFQNYKLLKDHFYLYGFQTRILKPFIKSRCQRDAAKAAADELGMTHECKNYFRKSGYRWYHFFPDVIFRSPNILLTKNFWLTTLFTKTYHSRIDYKNQHQFTERKRKFKIQPSY